MPRRGPLGLEARHGCNTSNNQRNTQNCEKKKHTHIYIYICWTAPFELISPLSDRKASPVQPKQTRRGKVYSSKKKSRNAANTSGNSVPRPFHIERSIRKANEPSARSTSPTEKLAKSPNLKTTPHKQPIAKQPKRTQDLAPSPQK